jgi:tetratricopeptide (TPR) repeat protein
MAWLILDFRFSILDCNGRDQMSFSLIRKIDICILAGVIALLSACEPQAVREEKALRRQLAHEMRNHSYESAVPLARQIIQRHPDDAHARKRLVQAQLGLHDFEGARQSLNDWRTVTQAASPKIDEFEGDIALQEHDNARAMESWKKSAAAQPKRRRVHEKIAALEQSQKHWELAIAAWTDALKAKDNAGARINRAMCERRLRRWDEAFSDLHHAQKLAANDADVQRASRTFEDLGKFLDEIRELDAKLAALPGDVGLLGDRSLLLLRSGDAELALDDAELAVRLAPWALRPKLFQAVALIALGRAKECDRLSIKQPLRLESFSPDFLETVSRLDSAISVEAKNADHFVARAWQLNEIGQPLLALQDAETALQLEPKSANANAEVSYALTKLGRSDEAFEKIKTATELDQSLASAWQYRGELEMQRGNNLAAIDSLSHALTIQQTVAGLQKREECYRRVGLLARAEEDHRALQQLTGGRASN